MNYAKEKTCYVNVLMKILKKKKLKMIKETINEKNKQFIYINLKMTSIINLFKIDIIKDKITSYLKYNDMGIYFTCKDIYNTLDKNNLQSKQVEYITRCFKDKKNKILVMTPILYKVIQYMSKLKKEEGYYIYSNLHILINLSKSYFGYDIKSCIIKIIFENDLLRTKSIRDNFILKYKNDIYTYLINRNMKSYIYKILINNINEFSYFFDNLKSKEDEYLYIIKKDKSLISRLENHSLSNIDKIYKEVFSYTNEVDFSKFQGLYDNLCDLKYIKNHDLDCICDIYMMAVKCNGFNIKYIKRHELVNISDIYLESLKSISKIQLESNNLNVYHFNESTSKILKYIKNHNCPKIYEIYKLSLIINPRNLEFVKRHDLPNIESLYMIAISKYPNSIQYIKNHNCKNIKELYRISLLNIKDRYDPFNCKWFKHFSFQCTFDVQLLLIIPSNVKFIQYNNCIPYKLKMDIIKIFIKKNIKTLKYLDKQYVDLEELFEFAFPIYNNIIGYVKFNGKDIENLYMKSIQRDISTLALFKTDKISNFKDICLFIRSELDRIYEEYCINENNDPLELYDRYEFISDKRFCDKIIKYNIYDINKIYDIVIQFDSRILRHIPETHPKLYELYFKAVHLSEAIYYIKNHNIPIMNELYKLYFQKHDKCLSVIINHNVRDIGEIYMKGIKRFLHQFENIKNHNVKNIDDIYKYFLDNDKRYLYDNLFRIKNHSIPIIRDIYKSSILYDLFNIKYIKNYSMISKQELDEYIESHLR